MKCSNCYNEIPDSFRSGLALGVSLAPHSPQAVVLVASGHSMDFDRLLDGFYSGVGTEDVLVVGGATEGFYQEGRKVSMGASAMGINGQGKVEFGVERSHGMLSEGGSAKEFGARMASLSEPPVFSFLFASMLIDGTRTAVDIAQGGFRSPWIGGMTGFMGRQKAPEGVVFHNREVLREHAVFLTLTGDVKAAMRVESGWRPFGRIGEVTRAVGTRLYEVDGRPTQEFFKHELGMELSIEEMATINLANFVEDDSGVFSNRTPYAVHRDGSVSLFGGVLEGTYVRCSKVTKDDVIAGAREAWRKTGIDRDPAAALIVSCAGRGWFLGDLLEEEARIAGDLYPSLPSIGFPSYGEFCPLHTKGGTMTETRFHNVSYISCLIG